MKGHKVDVCVVFFDNRPDLIEGYVRTVGQVDPPPGWTVDFVDYG